jgi:hypothetical protein
LGRAFNDLPELPAVNNLEEARGCGTQLAGDDARSAATTHPMDDAEADKTTQQADSSLRQPGARASTWGPKRTMETEAAAASASTPKRPHRACIIKTGTILLGEHSVVVVNLSEYCFVLSLILMNNRGSTSRTPHG